MPKVVPSDVVTLIDRHMQFVRDKNTRVGSGVPDEKTVWVSALVAMVARPESRGRSSRKGSGR